MKSFLFMKQDNKFVSWLISYWNYKQNKNHDKYFSILEKDPSRTRQDKQNSSPRKLIFNQVYVNTKQWNNIAIAMVFDLPTPPLLP